MKILYVATTATGRVVEHLTGARAIAGSIPGRSPHLPAALDHLALFYTTPVQILLSTNF